jgi:ABC-2 type transport system ATP-binding protein
VFLSSHLLAEVEQTCDRVAIVDHGRCVATAAVDDLLARPDGAQWIVEVGPGDLEPARCALAAAGLAVELASEGGAVRVRSELDGSSLTRVLAASGVWLRGLRREEVHLEDLFLELTATDPVVAA